VSDSYYVLRLGSVFRIIYMDEEAVSAWKRSGWELRSYDTNVEAQAALEKWRASLNHKPQEEKTKCSRNNPMRRSPLF
jgi:hypothetical protein